MQWGQETLNNLKRLEEIEKESLRLGTQIGTLRTKKWTVSKQERSSLEKELEELVTQKDTLTEERRVLKGKGNPGSGGRNAMEWDQDEYLRSRG